MNDDGMDETKARRLHDFRLLSFDVYGTLIDWEQGMLTSLAALRARAAEAGRVLSDDGVLEAHAFHESTAQAQTPTRRYPDILATVYRRLAEEWEVPATRAEAVAHGQSVGDWPAFPDSAESLRYLARHYRLVVLSNVDNDSLARSVERLGVDFHGLYSAEDIGSYKPSLWNFTYLLEQAARGGVVKAQILHVAESLFHDHVPARRMGIARCRIYRRHDKQGFGATRTPASLPSVQFTFTGMAELVAAHRAETAAPA